MKPDTLARLVCPQSRDPLRVEGDTLVGPAGQVYPLVDGRVDFIGVQPVTAPPDWLSQVKAWLKHRLGRGYIALTWLLSPVQPRLHWPSMQTWWRYQALELCRNKDLVIQIGSGNDRISDAVVNIDIFPFPEVDVVADCRRLPFANETVDGVISLAVLEHVPDPDAYLQEACRVLKPGGMVLTGVPFMQGFHASPDDYCRWTPSGLRELHQRHGLTMQWVVPLAGPTSGLIWILQEWLAMTLSLGFWPLYYAWYFFLLIMLVPFKLLDIILVHLPQAHKINSLYLYLGQKPEVASPDSTQAVLVENGNGAT